MTPALPTLERQPAAVHMRDVLFALAVGALAYAVSCVLVWPLGSPVSFGDTWQKMSERPFALVGDFPHRILTPLLAWLCGCRGEPGFLYFVRGMTIVMLATVWLVARRRGATRFDAALIAMAVALTSPVQIYKLHWVGYVDATTYTLLLWMVLTARRPVVFWGLFFAALLNHELSFFLLPWAWFLRREQDDWRLVDGVGAALALSVYAGFYFFVRAAMEQRYSIDYFASHPLFPGGTVAVWVLALVHCVVAFGPVLAVVAWFQHTRAHGRERLHFWLVLGGMLAIFCIAFDWARHSNLMLIPLVIASVRFLAAGHRLVYLLLIAAGVVGMVLVTPWPSKSWPTYEIVDPAFTTGVVVVEQTNVTFGPLRATLTQWLPTVWPTLWPILLIAASIWLAGALLARWRPDAAPPPA